MIQIETPRLHLCSWEEDDWARFKPIATDPRVMRFIGNGTPWSDQQIRDFVSRNRTLFQERGFCRWKLEEKNTGTLAGFCGLGFLRDQPSPEIGWWLAHAYWGRGLATEAARAAFDDAKQRLRIPRVVSIAHPENHASIRIMEKLGFRLEKHTEYLGNPVVMYSYEQIPEAGA